jgi:hypothetical protein
MYYLSLIPTKIANTVEVSGNEGWDHLLSVSVSLFWAWQA